ncbi:Ubiquitin-60S ribosomal protein [Colletotrichum siamense]|uniref:Ubiquitin-60S ribosomal protein n=1 Tax=Colletotrichum siamense TaxID=690259 RepID=UPI001872189A|nr:Ubiquitin-60S ribosomal protein [Colletotrichum siamense]KAF5491585.1 Ubiquitin-60S ribosomal protein [Colletotrichum siamense]
MSVVIIVFDHRRRLIGLPDSYESLIQKARAEFNLGDADLLVQFTPPFLDQEVELDPTAYHAIPNESILLFSKLHSQQTADPEPKRKRTKTGKAPQPTSSFVVHVKTMTGKITPIETKVSATVGELKALYYEWEGVPPEAQRLIFQGSQMEDNRTLASYSVKDNDLIHFVARLCGGKPAIYLMSPTKLSSVSVDVTLTQHWGFSTLYPIIKPAIVSGKSRVTWQVSVCPDGTLETLGAPGTKLQCSYLFWEAEAFADGCVAPEHSADYPFNPQSPHLCVKGSAAHILSFDNFLPYLDKVLQTLTLTPAMRTEFIVYWLPKFMKIRDRGQDIAFDFVPQSDFQKVAHLEIEPRPDTVARVFLIFRGAFKQTHGQKTLAELEAIDWSARIGIDVAEMKDAGTFRALEWGGMEVITV